MRKLLTFALLVFLSLVAFAQQKPEPFGLKLGVSTKEETMNVIAKEGGRVVDSGYKVIKGDTSGEKLPPYLRLPEKAIAYSVAIKVSK
jgi:hypothetical protein